MKYPHHWKRCHRLLHLLNRHPCWKPNAMMLAAVHPYGHEEPLEISRTEFESLVRNGFYFEEDTLEELSLDEVFRNCGQTADQFIRKSQNTFFKYIFITEKLPPARKAKCLFYSPEIKIHGRRCPQVVFLLLVRTVASRDTRGFT